VSIRYGRVDTNTTWLDFVHINAEFPFRPRGQPGMVLSRTLLAYLSLRIPNPIDTFDLMVSDLEPYAKKAGGF